MVDYKPLNVFPVHAKNSTVRLKVCVKNVRGLRTNRFPARRSHRGRSGDRASPRFQGVCVQSIAFAQGLRHPRRITIPASRNTLTQAFEASVSWEKALDLFAERLRRVRDREGAHRWLSAATRKRLDFYVGARRFARLWGTPHVYHPWETPKARRICH